MLIKKGKFYYYYLDNVPVDYDIINWITPFGLEHFGKKEIVNLKIPDNNDGNNLIKIIEHISDEIQMDFESIPKKPIKNGLLRCEVKTNEIYDKNDTVDGRLMFRIYNFRGDYGISVILKKN